MSRTNQKLLLMRDHVQQQDRREALQRQNVSTSEMSHNSVAHSAPQGLCPQSPQHQQILRVQSDNRLENPTSYHVLQTQKMPPSLDGTPQSQVHSSFSGPQSPFPLSPDSPLSAPPSSASEFDEGIWDDLNRTLGLDMHDAISNDQSTAIASTLPADINSFMYNPPSVGVEDSQQSLASDSTKLSTSCPPLNEAEMHMWAKERQKKDNHNKIERRRRYNINDRIKELGTLLPREDSRYFELVRDMKQNKGTILKASVDFLKCLKKEVSKIPDLEKKHKNLELENRRMMMRIQQLEQQMIHGLRTSDSPDISSPASFPHQRHHNSWSQSTLGGNGNGSQYPTLLSSSFSSPVLRNETHAQNDMVLSPGQPQLGSLSLTDSGLYNQRMSSHTITNSSAANHIPATLVKQEYSESPGQLSSGLGSLTSPSPAALTTSSAVQYSHVLLEDQCDPLFAGLIKDEALSPQAMDI